MGSPSSSGDFLAIKDLISLLSAALALASVILRFAFSAVATIRFLFLSVSPGILSSAACSPRVLNSNPSPKDCVWRRSINVLISALPPELCKKSSTGLSGVLFSINFWASCKKVLLTDLAVWPAFGVVIYFPH